MSHNDMPCSQGWDEVGTRAAIDTRKFSAGYRQDLLLSEQTPPSTFDFALTNTESTSLLAFFFPQK